MSLQFLLCEQEAVLCF